MTIVFVLLTVQSLLGAFDNFWHHEREARLPQRTSARYELRLHAAKQFGHPSSTVTLASACFC